MRALFTGLLLTAVQMAAQPYVDATHASTVLGGPRNYRLFLPADYSTSTKRYPVIYYFHGHSDRYTLEKYDQGTDTVPKIAGFVRSHDVIVVAVDGYVARDYTGFYGGSPWDVRIEVGQYDFGAYFLELVAHIDGKFRTLTGRRHRATSGLSMGGFMSAYLAARFPDRIGSASIFNPGPEFYAGEPGRRSLWRPKDHVANLGHSMVRLIRASGDYISQYHEETRAAFASSAVDFEFRQDEYHRHWATSIGETFDFHMRAFSNTLLDTTPEDWDYANAHTAFQVWGYSVKAQCPQAAILSLEHVTQGGFRTRTRSWAPDGPPARCAALTISTAALYQPGQIYRALDFDVSANRKAESDVKADPEGRLTVTTGTGVHEISFSGPGTGAEPPVLLPLTSSDFFRVRSGKPIDLPIRIYNSRGVPQQNLSVEITSPWPTVEVLKGTAAISELASGTAADISRELRIRCTAGDSGFARARLQVRITYDGWHAITRNVDILIAPDDLQPPSQVVILDGRTATFPVFKQKGNQGGGSSIQREVKEGRGNGNGILEPGEDATIWLLRAQGVDPFDKHNWCRAKVYPESEFLTEIADIQETKQTEWTGAQNRTSLVHLSELVPVGAKVPMILDCESWSFQSSPDVRYGREPLYQPFQVHRHHLYSWTWDATLPAASPKPPTAPASAAAGQ